MDSTCPSKTWYARSIYDPTCTIHCLLIVQPFSHRDSAVIFLIQLFELSSNRRESSTTEKCPNSVVSSIPIAVGRKKSSVDVTTLHRYLLCIRNEGERRFRVGNWTVIKFRSIFQLRVPRVRCHSSAEWNWSMFFVCRGDKGGFITGGANPLPYRSGDRVGAFVPIRTRTYLTRANSEITVRQKRFN